MFSAGVDSVSGECQYKLGIPCKSGECGAMMIVVPNEFGACFFAPELIPGKGIGAQSLDFCNKLVQRFSLHQFDRKLTDDVNVSKDDPSTYRGHRTHLQVSRLLSAASVGDSLEVKHLHALGTDVNSSDYDMRTAAHVAAAEGHLNVIQFLIWFGADLTARDRWGKTP